ncbi:MAG: sensor histidine kinase, partial [Candidatus Anammoxibacter sp.]
GDFNRPSTGVKVSVNIETIIGVVVLMCRKQLNAREIEVEIRHETAPLIIAGIEDQLTQVFLNLLQNAEESITGREGGKITISTERKNRDAIIRIQDTGCGVDQKRIKHLFEPFFSTKLSSKGTGLGLFVCYGIIKKHNGEIWVSNAPEKGTIFTITLPAKEGDAS